MTKTKELQVQEAEIAQELALEAKQSSLPEIVSPMGQPTLQQMVDEETSNRKIISKFITDHMKKGTDYAPIHINKTCQNKWNCTDKYHFSKDNLTKAGAEKMGSLLALRPETTMDRETWEMAGSRPGLYCYKCNLYNARTGALIGDGLGACDKSEKSGSDNTAIKIAKKRAFVDAILSVGKLSDFFTQDLEDMSQVKQESASYAPKNEPEPVKNIQLITPEQILIIKEKMKELNRNQEWLQTVIASRGKNTLEELSLNTGKAIIERLDQAIAKKEKPSVVEKSPALQTSDIVIRLHKAGRDQKWLDKQIAGMGLRFVKDLSQEQIQTIVTKLDEIIITTEKIQPDEEFDVDSVPANLGMAI